MILVTTTRHLIIDRLRWLLATGDERDAEILALRHQHGVATTDRSAALRRHRPHHPRGAVHRSGVYAYARAGLGEYLGLFSAFGY